MLAGLAPGLAPQELVAPARAGAKANTIPSPKAPASTIPSPKAPASTTTTPRTLTVGVRARVKAKDGHVSSVIYTTDTNSTNVENSPAFKKENLT